MLNREPSLHREPKTVAKDGIWALCAGNLSAREARDRLRKVVLHDVNHPGKEQDVEDFEGVPCDLSISFARLNCSCVAWLSA